MTDAVLATNTYKMSGYVFRDLRYKGVNIFNSASLEVSKLNQIRSFDLKVIWA